MDFIVEQRLIIDGELIINKGDIIKIKLVTQEVIQGEFKSADEDFEELTIYRNDREWVFEFDDIEEIEVIKNDKDR